jgi:hypothetical protein
MRLVACRQVTYDEGATQACRLFDAAAADVDYSAGSLVTIINQATCQGNSDFGESRRVRACQEAGNSAGVPWPLSYYPNGVRTGC